MTELRVAAKACVRCAVVKSLDEFHKDTKALDGRVGWCKACRREYRAEVYARDPQAAKDYQREWKRRNPKKVSEYGRRHRHGMEPHEYDAMVAAQAGRCAICGDVVKLKVDHDHSTGKIRGLLCDRCNRGLGFFRDDPEALASAVTYLWRHNQGGDAL